MPKRKIAAFGLSDIGLIRKNNEDVWGQIAELKLYVLADGMGGHQAGEIAAKEAVRLLCELVRNNWSEESKRESFHDMRKGFRQAIEKVNAEVYKLSRAEPSLKGMGTTLCTMFFLEKGLVYAHVGDSRIYRLRRRKLEQLTKDHSLFRELVDQGQMSEHEGADFQYRNIITRAIGTEPTVDPSVHLSDVENGDVYLMCTDGLSDLLSTKEMQNILNHGMSLEETVRELIVTANARGGHDNITIVVVKVLESSEKENLS